MKYLFPKGHKINFGRKHTPEHNLRISLGGKGKKRSEITKMRISKAKLGCR
jgi:hypothetical protein